ncbi:helicase HerA domain-containing protein [Vulcanisaeta distributa]|uniref:AAA+ ATPase domain-containing protein n=1 Tax=Vulcanisaeta distributa (strain DSM 14429 / JCM 11212 / NBRC 100878 / IC-017) TaxID=572478 RepID=E1QSN3_VULDI|nr:DUF87 domain-containing protein [Vulcanisaeta distributa]ADN49550.1 protein of unknown function DUF87 [Vulcanisaeta distributa DSM 14429]
MPEIDPRIYLAILIGVIVMGIVYRPLILLLPLAMLYRDFREWLVESILTLIYPGLAPRLVLGEDYVYDARGRLMHVFYSAEPMFDISRLTGAQYVGLFDELIRRLNLGTNEAIAFIRLGGEKFIRLSRVVRGEDELQDFMNWLTARENLLRQYFVLRQLGGEELRRLVGFPTTPSKARLITALVTLLLASYLLFRVYGLITIAAIAAITVKSLGNYSVIRGGQFSVLRRRLATSNKIYTMPSDDDVRAVASAVANYLQNYALIISGNPEFRAVTSTRVAREYEKLVVQERGKALPAVSRWRVVLDRITQNAEEPVRVMILSDRDLPDTNMRMAWLRGQLPLWSMPTIDELSHDVAIVPIFHGGRLIAESSRARVRLGRDREGSELEIDLDALPSGHMLVVGPTGMGKTWTVSTILHRLMNSGIKALILDPHGEYLRIQGIEPIDVTRKFINFFELDGLTDVERVHRLITEFSILGIDAKPMLPDLRLIYSNGIYRDFFKAMEFLRAATDDDSVALALDRLMSHLRGAEVVPVSELLNNKALLFGSVRASPDVMAFMMGVVADHVYSHVMSMSIGEQLRQLLIIDEAYYLLNSPLAELLVRGVRKFGLGTVFITQTLTGIGSDVLQNIPLIIVLGGNDAYVASVSQALQLTSEDMKWLVTALPPHMQGLTTKALIITEPIKRLGIIELEPRIKEAQQ